MTATLSLPPAPPTPQVEEISSVVIYHRDTTVADRAMIRKNAYDAIKSRALANGTGIADSLDNLVIRSIEPWGAIAARDARIVGAAAALPSFLVGAIVVGVETAVVNQAVDQNCFHIWYGVSFQPVAPQVEPQTTLLRFALGAAGQTNGRFQLEGLFADGGDQGPFECYFAQPIIYRPGQAEWIGITTRATIVNERVMLLGYVAETAGQFVGRQVG